MPFKQLQEWYLDFLNNYLTIEKWAEHHQVSVKEANDILSLGKKLHENRLSGDF